MKKILRFLTQPTTLRWVKQPTRKDHGDVSLKPESHTPNLDN